MAFSTVAIWCTLNYFSCNVNNFFLQLAGNGLVTFVFDLVSYQVQRLPRIVYPVIPIIAPLWTTFVPQTFGTVFRRITSDPVQLSWVKSLILLQNPHLQDYEPTVAIIATWHDFVLPNSDGKTVSIVLCIRLV